MLMVLLPLALALLVVGFVRWRVRLDEFGEQALLREERKAERRAERKAQRRARRAERRRNRH